jgi:hypothetical protein
MVTSVAGAVALAEQSRRPGKVKPILLQYPPLPETWDELLAKADLVATVRLRKGPSLREILVDDAGGREIVSVFQADTLELIKNHPRNTSEQSLQIMRLGGEVDGPQGRIAYREEGFPDWGTSTVILIFLKWDTRLEGYFPLYGPDGSYELDSLSGKVRTFGRGSIAMRQKGRAFPDMVSEVKAKSK